MDDLHNIYFSDCTKSPASTVSDHIAIAKNPLYYKKILNIVPPIANPVTQSRWPIRVTSQFPP